MGFQVDLKEFKEVLEKLQNDTSKNNEQLEQAKNALNGIIQADAMQGATGEAIVNDINNNQNAVVVGLKDTNKILITEMATTLQDFQSTTGETDENAVILEDALLQTQNKLSNLQPKKHELDSRISNIYNSVNDLVSLSMPNSQFDEKLVAASKELEDTIQKVQQFESKKAESDAGKFLDQLNKQVQMAREMGSLSYTDPQLQAFFAQDALAKGIHEMDTQITNAEKEAKLEAEREMKKKQEEWAAHHPVEAWLQDLSKSAGEKWDVLRKGTKWVGDNIPLLRDLSNKALVLEGFIGAAGSAISGIAIGAMKVTYLALELGEWGFNSIRGVETEQWKLDDLNATWQGVKKLGEYALVAAGTSNPVFNYLMNNKALTDKVPILNDLAQTFRTDQKQIFTMGANYLKNILTDPYALGGAIFDIGSCFIGVGEVTAAVKGGKLAQGAKVFQVAEKSGKIGGKLEEIAALMNKLPDSMKNVVEKIKNIEIPSFGPKTAFAGIGNGGGGNTLGELFSAFKSGTNGTVNRTINGTVGASGVKTLVKAGEHFTNGRKNRLKPNIRYKTGEYDYFYETDHLGRIEKFETDKLQLTKREKRLSHSKNTLGKIKGKDHAGHLAGDRFGGSPKLDNLVSQLSDVNLKKYKKLEEKWAAALKETPPKEVTVKVDIIYSGNDMRPDKFIVNYTIDGKPGSAKFKNL